MKKFKRLLILSAASLLAASSVLGIVACGENGGGGGRGGGGKTVTLQFWGSGDEDEDEVFGQIVKNFNATIGKEKNIVVNYSSEHGDLGANVMQLGSNDAPDVIYVDDRNVKAWVSQGLIEPLTDPNNNNAPRFEGLEEFTAPGKVWEQGIRRYRFDTATQTVSDDATLWALPKDIGPTALYYNREYMNQMGIQHISMTAEEAYKAGYPEKGYFQHTDGKWYFNNKVPMSWDEVTDLATKMQNEITDCKYGYFTEWWFSYGWSIGGDCVEYVSEGTDSDGNPMGYYEFTLADETPNYIVRDDDAGFTVNGTAYKAGEIISYTDKQKLTADQKGHCNELPTMKDAFIEFVSLTTPTNKVVDTNTKGQEVMGKQVSMGQNSIGTQSARDRFAAGSIGMFVGGRWEVTHLRKKIGIKNSWMKDQDSWDVAPLPMYKEYNADGSVKVHGVQAGHSGSMGLAIAFKSKHKKEAWELVKYVAGAPGQTAQAERGFCIPNQIEIAKTDVFLQPDKAPKNAQVFVDAAQYETPGDWWYLKDGLWIDNWADCLNKEVRENTKTVTQLFDTWKQPTQTKLYTYTYNSHNLSAKPKK